MAISDRILSLDIGASTLKLAEFRKSRAGGLELVRYAVQSLGLDPHDDDDRSRYVITTLRDMVAEHGIKPGPVVISVSGQSVFSRYVPLPPVDESKIPQLVLYEAQQHVPFPMDEVVWDYQLIDGGEGSINVMLAAIKGEMVEELTDCVGFSGLRPDLVDVAPMALYNCARYNYPELGGCTLIVDIGARSTDLIFLEGNRVFSRSIPFAGNAITQQIMREFDMTFDQAEELKLAHAFVAFGGAYEAPSSDVADKVSKSVRTIMTRMHAEINRSINFYRTQQSGSQPDLVLITGGTSLIPYTDTFLSEKLKVDVDYLNPFLNVAVSESIDSEEIGESAHLLGEVVGLALRRTLTCPIELNLMPPKVLAQKAFKKKQPILIGAMIVSLLTLGVWSGYFVKMTKLASARYEKVESRVNVLKSRESRMKVSESEIQATQTKIDKLAELGNRRTEWLALTDQIYANLDEGMWLSRLAPAEPEERVKQEAVDPRSRRSSRRTPTVSDLEGLTNPDVTAIQFTGFGYNDKVKGDNPVLELRNRLREIPGVTAEKTEVVLDRQDPDGFLREFEIRINLETPIKQ